MNETIERIVLPEKIREGGHYKMLQFMSDSQGPFLWFGLSDHENILTEFCKRLGIDPIFKIAEHFDNDYEVWNFPDNSGFTVAGGGRGTIYLAQKRIEFWDASCAYNCEPDANHLKEMEKYCPSWKLERGR